MIIKALPMSEENKKTVEESIEAVIEEVNTETVKENEIVTDENESEECVEASVDEKEKMTDMIELLGNKLAIAEEEVKVEKDNVVRAKAHAQNEIRKSGIDAESKVKRTLKRFTEELLPVIDSLEMAISHIDKENEAVKALGEGVEMTLKSMVAAFTKVGINQLNPVGEQADANKHQIVSQQAIEGKEANEVVVVMQKGYEYNGSLIRPAMVMVAQG